MTDCNFLAYSCAAARDFHPLPSSSVLTRLREPEVLRKNKSESNKIYTVFAVKVNASRNCGRRRIRIMIPQDLLDILVCPVCKKPLAVKQNGESLKCGECHRVYPVRDDIPILLVDEAVTEPS